MGCSGLRDGSGGGVVGRLKVLRSLSPDAEVKTCGRKH